jgi:hypothetical protein
MDAAAAAESGATAPDADPFAQGATEDPFAGADGATPDIPIVDKEGEPVEIDSKPFEETVRAEEEAAEAAAEEQPAAPAAESAPVPAPEPEAAPEPQEAASAPQTPGDAPRGGKSPMRHYHLMVQTGPKTWEELEWEEDDPDRPGKKRKQKVVDARNQEHAFRLAWLILGQPENGATVLPIPTSQMKPKRLNAKPVEPRVALSIS